MEDPKKAAAPCDPPSICSAELAGGKPYKRVDCLGCLVLIRMLVIAKLYDIVLIV